MGIPIVAMCDTNSDPDEIECPIPSNDDAIRAVKLITGKIADAVLEGQSIRMGVAEEIEEGVAGDFSDITVASFSPDDEPVEAAPDDD